MIKAFILCLLTLGYVLSQSAEDYRITSLPGIDITTLNFIQYAGHIEVSNETDRNLFFWMIESEKKLEKEKLILWLNGGPGCSSMDGLFLENGPYRVNKDKSLSINAGGWQQYATVLYVDQPVGTGFSFSDFNGYRHSLDEIAEDVIMFMDKIYELFPNLKQYELYIAGESFAGTYIPYIGHRLLQLNKKEDKGYNLHGLAIGNGWISSQHQYDAYYDYAMTHGLINDDYKPMASKHLRECHEKLKENDLVHISECEKILTDIIDSSTHENDAGEKVCINSYDIRLTEEPSPACGLTWPYELDVVTEYLRLPELKRAVHSEKQLGGWDECSSTVSKALTGDRSKSAYYLLPDILKEVPILLYSGEYDLICNYIGTEYMIGNMTWNGAQGYKKSTKKEDWKIDNHVVGYYKEERNLSFVFIKDGSHMVPYDKPLETLDMINRFINVGDGMVNGKQSSVGNRQANETVYATGDNKNDTRASEDDSDSVDAQWSDYHNIGTVSVVVLVIFAILCCWRSGKRKHSATAQFGGAPQQTREGAKQPMSLKSILSYFKGSRKINKPFRLENQDESNELDELVVDMPTVYEVNSQSEDEDDHDKYAVGGRARSSHSLSDDEFDDFADWDDGEAIMNSENNRRK
ncbi:Alpha/Beta hydrolase protein [Pilobolus umbonatus]|nr:Alpha/Beta hydrolase protein [Pilobolus umbonatus]